VKSRPYNRSMIAVQFAIALAVLLTVGGLAFTGFGRLWSQHSIETALKARSRALDAGRVSSLQHRSLTAYGRSALSFEPNVGQAEAAVKFLSRGHGFGLFLTSSQAVLSLKESSSNPRTAEVGTPGKRSFRTVRLRLLSSNQNAGISGLQPQKAKSNYLIGDKPNKWRTDVPHYARVEYRSIYPGVDMVYYGHQGQLEYDFRLAPGSDPSAISYAVDGVDSLKLNQNGDLVLGIGKRQVVFRRPVAYQVENGKQRPVSASYIVDSGSKVRFQLGAFDHRRELVIDPELAYSTYLGGSGDDTSPKVAVDSTFNAYVAGTTASANFPVLGPLQAAIDGANDVFVSKFDISGALVYSTYLGGSGTESVAGVGVDASSNIYVTGSTTSADFPTIVGFQAAPKGGAGLNHVFLAKIKPDGTALVYSTYVSGSATDTSSGLALGGTEGRVYLAGITQSADFPTTAGVVGPNKPAGTTSQFFVSKFDTTKSGASSLVYSSYLGGTQPPNAQNVGGGIGVDSVGNVYVAGGTAYTDYPVVNAAQPSPKGGIDAFVTKLNTGATARLYSTYLGGAGDDFANGLAVDQSGNSYVAGSTASDNYPVLVPFQATRAGGTDAFLTKLSVNGATIYSTYLGGTSDDAALAVSADLFQNAYVTGSTTSSDFNLLNSFQAYGGGMDAFVAGFRTSGASVFSSYLGGSGDDEGTGVAADVEGNPYIAGDTTSTDFPVLNPAQAALSGGKDAFLTKLGGVSDIEIVPSVSPNPIGVGNAAAFLFTIMNNGPDPASGVILSDVLPQTNALFSSASATQGNCSPPAGSPATVVCNVGFIPVGGRAAVTVNISGTTAGVLSNSASVSSNSRDPNPSNNSGSKSTNVTDFSLSVAPNTATVPAGQAASYTVTISPQPAGSTFSNQITLSCSAGIPTSITCTFSPNPATPNGSPITATLAVQTTVRPATTTTGRLQLKTLRPIFAAFLPFGGLLWLGWAPSKKSKYRKIVGCVGLAFMLGLILLQPACGGGSSSSSTPTNTGTPAGNYAITISGNSGTAVHTTSFTLTVQ